MASADIAMNIQQHEDFAGSRHDDDTPLIKYYRATEPLPSIVPVLNNFLRKGPAIWAAVQVSSGFLSFGVGVVFAVSFEIQNFLLTLLRVPIITGIVFVFSGLLSNLLYKHPGLLETCFFANIGCLAVSGIGTILLAIDLYPSENNLQYKMRILMLCVTLMDLAISSVLIFWIHKEKRSHKQ